jgi:RimJ/RimL family protein N-acetyltransferase
MTRRTMTPLDFDATDRAATAAFRFRRPDLTDGVVTLRRWRGADTTARHQAFLDPMCLRFSYPLEGEPTEGDVVELFDANERGRLAGRELNLAVVDASELDDIWGAASLYDTDPVRRSVSVGYWVARHARGRGVATSTLRLLADWAFRELGVERLELTSAPDNEASHRVAERCGFVREGVLRAHLPFKGRRRDTVVFSLLPGELRQRSDRER